MSVWGLLNGSDPRAARSTRLCKAAAFGAVLAFATLTTACAQPAESRPAEPPRSTPLLADFTRYCLDTRVEREPAVAAAKSASLDVLKTPRNGARTGVPMVGWAHLTEGRVVVTGFAGEERGSDGAVHAMQCQAADAKDDGASLKVIDEWLGPGHRLHASGAVHEFELRGGRVWPIDGDDPKALAASRATGNHYVLIALHLKTVTTLSLRRWRAPST